MSRSRVPAAAVPAGRPDDCVAPTRGAAVALLLLALAGCVNLEPVREFGRSAATLATFPVAGDTYRDSAVASQPYVRAAPESFVAAPARAAQVRSAIELQAELGRYFATLARLAGADAYDLDAEIGTLGKGTASLGGFSKAAVDASVRLVRVLARAETSRAQLGAVQELVRDGGPAAMQILEALRQVSDDWTAQVENDARQVDQTLEVAALPGDVPPLLRLLADDRRAQMKRDYAAGLRRMRASSRALERLQAAHADLAAHLDELGEGAVRVRLARAATELRSLRTASGAWLEAR